MSKQMHIPIAQKLQALDHLYSTASRADDESALQSALNQLDQAFPGLTIAFAEISTTGSKRQAHGGMCHVLMPTEGSK